MWQQQMKGQYFLLLENYMDCWKSNGSDWKEKEMFGSVWYHVGRPLSPVDFCDDASQSNGRKPQLQLQGQPNRLLPLQQLPLLLWTGFLGPRAIQPNWPINWRMRGDTLRCALPIHFDNVYIIIKCCFTSGEWPVNIHLDFWVKVVSKMLPHFTRCRANASVRRGKKGPI